MADQPQNIHGRWKLRRWLKSDLPRLQGMAGFPRIAISVIKLCCFGLGIYTLYVVMFQCTSNKSFHDLHDKFLFHDLLHLVAVGTYQSDLSGGKNCFPRRQ